MSSDEVARELVRQGWTLPQWRRVDGGPDYYEDRTKHVTPPKPLPDIRAERLSRVVGRVPLSAAKLMIADGYEPTHVARTTGWGLWWLQTETGKE